LPDAIETLLRVPVLTRKALAVRLRIAPQTATALVRDLRVAGLAREVTGRGSFRAFAIRGGGATGHDTRARLRYWLSVPRRKTPIVMAGSHVVVGIAAWTWAAPHLGLPPLDPRALALTTIGALLPDIDHPTSWVGRRLRVISRPLAAMIGHRGVTHSVLAVLACLLMLHWQGVSRAAIDPLVIGYLSHLAADLLTSGGLRLAWPLRQRQAIPLCRTGSLSESIIVACVAAWAGLTILRLHPGFGL
jgi:inner membrane protein